ncbi:MAG: hypothetical protein LBM02_10440 [Lachnospiraceae bacterium]|nr:hypothetical protein [Lachnospiraceae bacterium]
MKILKFLEKNCSTFSLVEPNIGYSDFPYELPNLKVDLQDYLRKSEKVTSWPGTKCKVAKGEEKPVLHNYECSRESIKYLKKYNSFWDIEEQMDIAFYKTFKCILYTISHEEMLVVDLAFWGNFFEYTNCVLIKSRS